MDTQCTVARAYAFSHSYRKHLDRAPLSEKRPPIRYKRLLDCERVTLPVANAALLRQPLSQVFETACLSQLPRPEASFLSLLATLLYFNLGVLQIDFNQGVQPHSLHRPFPSPGSLYSSELYVYVPDGKEITGGLYHYHGFYHDLSLLRQRQVREVLEQAVQRELGEPEVVLIVGSDLWRVIRKYADFGYRLISLEAGHLVGNILLVAAALGLQGYVYYQFHDDLLEACLGAPHLHEEVLAVIPLYRVDAHAPKAASCCIPTYNIELQAALAAISGRWLCSSGMDSTQAKRARVLARAIRTWHEPATPLNGLSGVQEQAVASDTTSTQLMLDIPAPTADLLSAYQLRNAGLYAPHGLAAHITALPEAALARILAHIMSPYCHDLAALQPERPRYVRPVLMANRVQNVRAGSYEIEARTGALIARSHTRYPRGIFGYRDTINSTTLAAAWGLVADYDAAFTQLGERAYRIVNMEAGIVAQRLCLLNAALGLFARPFCAFDEAAQDRWLGMEESSEQVIYTVLCGYNRVDPLRFTIL